MGRTGAPPVRAVLFDWGGTLTPAAEVDLADLWRAAAQVLAPERADAVTRALVEAEAGWWRQAVASGRSGTTADVFAAAAAALRRERGPDGLDGGGLDQGGLDQGGTDRGGLDLDAALHDQALQALLEAWTPHTVARPAAAPLLRELRRRGIRTGLLSNTHWPRAWHERWLARDGLLDLLDARVYTSDLPHLKPHPEAFRAALSAVTGDGPPIAPAEVVFVGDRPVDDISGAAGFGMRTVLLPAAGVPDSPVEPDVRIEHLAQVADVVQQFTAAAGTIAS